MKVIQYSILINYYHQLFTKKEMIINPDKLYLIKTNIPLIINNQTIKSVASVKLLGIQLDGKLNFNLHISNICQLRTN